MVNREMGVGGDMSRIRNEKYTTDNSVFVCIFKLFSSSCRCVSADFD